jgi:hypothetical protein
MTGRVIMYRSFYGLTAEPFSKEIDVTKLFQHSNLKALPGFLWIEV